MSAKKKLFIGGQAIDLSNDATCDWCGLAKDCFMAAYPVKMYAPQFKSVDGHLVEDWEYKSSFWGKRYKAVVGEIGYDSLYIRDWEAESTKKAGTPTICQDCTEQLAKYRPHLNKQNKEKK